MKYLLLILILSGCAKEPKVSNWWSNQRWETSRDFDINAPSAPKSYKFEIDK